MKKIILSSIIFCICLSPMFSQAHIRNGQNIFEGLFTEPIEILYVISWDGRIYGFTTYNEISVKISYGVMKDFLKKNDIEISDIAIMAHNHFRKLNFSDGDLRSWRYLILDGFRGSFCLYIRGINKVKYLRDENAILTQFLKKKETKKFLKKFRKEFPKAYKELVAFLKEIKNG